MCVCVFQSKDCEKAIGELSKMESLKTEEIHSTEQDSSFESLTGAAKSLCIPFDQPELPANTKCICADCGCEAKNWTMFGRSY